MLRTSFLNASGTLPGSIAGTTPSSLRAATCSLTADSTASYMRVKVLSAFGSMPKLVSAFVTFSRTVFCASPTTSCTWMLLAMALMSCLSDVALPRASLIARLNTVLWRLRFSTVTLPFCFVIFTPLALSSASRFSAFRSTSAARRDFSQKLRTSSADRFSPFAMRATYWRNS